ncbi:MAG: ArsB/NhaD family transporter [gamma proteobacterium symbiont of Bathyaustriella thionipta]|nr:ArsB/NhaD family transporter [gamma proteobacterium symbiont of Bathyaustriella thionipta]
MHPQTGDNLQLVFGIDPLWYAGSLFVLTYLLIMSDRLNRAIVAMLAAGLMIFGGILTQQAALQGIDFNTLGLLTGMMIIVAVSKQSGMFQFLAIWSAKRVKADPWGILVMLLLVTAVLSALLDNVTTVLLIAPVTLLITDALKVNAYPYLFAEIFAANIGGTATLIGDPPNIMIGSAAGLGFNDFILNLGPLVAIILPVTLIPIYLIWGRKLHAADEDRLRVMNYREQEAITDKALLIKSLVVLALVMCGFIFAHQINQQPASIALFGAALMLFLVALPKSPAQQVKDLTTTFAEIEWITLFFFIGLFVLVHGVEKTGLLRILANQVLSLTGGDLSNTSVGILWVSAIASALVDNIPFVATMIPMIEDMSATLGGPEALRPLWWSLAIGACLGGNGSLIGASANLIIAGFAERSGQRIRRAIGLKFIH